MAYRFRSTRNSDTINVLGIFRTKQHQKNMMIALVTDRTTNETEVHFRNPDGTHPHGNQILDIVSVDMTGAQVAYETMPSALANAIKVLWQEGKRSQAVDVMPTDLARADVWAYFEAKFG